MSPPSFFSGSWGTRDPGLGEFNETFFAPQLNDE